MKLSMFAFLKRIESESVEIDSRERALIHRYYIATNPYLQSVYNTWYSDLFQMLDFKKDMKVLELGSGSRAVLSDQNDLYRHLITSDVSPGLGTDLVIDSEKIPLGNASLDGLLTVNVFHHFMNVENFFSEAMRVLKPGGKIVMCEPWYSPWSAFVYRNFHHEDFNPGAGWQLEAAGPLSRANGAQAWIVFKRDRQIYESKYPSLNIIDIRPHTAVNYILSGGYSFKPMVPVQWYSTVDKIDQLLSSAGIPMFANICLKKIG